MIRKIKHFILKKLDILSLKKKVNKLEEANKKNKDHRAKLKKKIAYLEGENSAIKQQLGELRLRIAESEKKNSSLKSMADNQERQIRNLIRENDKIHKEMHKQISNLERYIFSQNRGLADGTRTPRIIVSLTSYPARISVVFQVLERMLVQTLRPDKVILWLAKEQFPNREADLPDELLALCEEGGGRARMV